VADDERPRVVAEFSNYDELINGMRLRAAELNLSGQELDCVSNLPDRYCQKLLGPNSVRRLGLISLGPFLGALAVRGLLVEDSAHLFIFWGDVLQPDRRQLRARLRAKFLARQFNSIMPPCEPRLCGESARQWPDTQGHCAEAYLLLGEA
jgi:hypothetical protein